MLGRNDGVGVGADTGTCEDEGLPVGTQRALKPAASTEPSELNSTNNDPDVPIIVGTLATLLPVSSASRGAPALVPSYTAT